MDVEMNDQDYDEIQMFKLNVKLIYSYIKLFNLQTLKTFLFLGNAWINTQNTQLFMELIIQII